MTKKIKITGIVLIIALAISLIGLALTLYKYITLDRAVKDNTTKVYTMLLLSDEEDNIFYKYETKNASRMETLYELLQSDEITKDLTIGYRPYVTGYGYSIDTITFKGKTYGDFNSTNYWHIYSPTDHECNQMPDNYCQSGISNLYMSLENVYEFTLSSQ